jgi:dsDNA-specific endonuclease/ATPase MutS2
MPKESDYFDNNPVELVIDGILDLHTFSPKDLKTLIPDYLDVCLLWGIFEVKIILGKGIGNLKRSVHALLDRNPLVSGYRTDDMKAGNWGATIVMLKLK